jgi:hypothetical protein
MRVSFNAQILQDFIDQSRAKLLAGAVHWQLTGAITTPDSQMTRAAIMVFERTAAALQEFL